MRVAWESLPNGVQGGIERICGAAVVRADSQPGGFSPGVAARLSCADGSRWFVKAVSAEVNSVSPGMHRREAEVLRGLDPLIAAGTLAVPRLRGILDQPPWMALVLADVEGKHPALPWRAAELAAVLAALDRLACTLTPAPVAISSLAEQFGTAFTGWQTLAAGTGRDLDRLDRWSLEHLAVLVELERAWPAYAGGDTVVHADIRADNVLLTSDGPVILDWPHACVGAAFTDLVFLAPSVAMQGGPEPARAPDHDRGRPRGEPGCGHGHGLRARGLLHRVLAASAAARNPDRTGIPGGPGCRRPPLARHPALTTALTRDAARAAPASPPRRAPALAPHRQDWVGF